MASLWHWPALTLAAATPASGQPWTVVLLHPPGNQSSTVEGVTASRQAGSVRLASGWNQGGFWRGSAGSWIPFTPDGEQGGVYGLDDAQQVGAFRGAALWSGTPESRVELQPPGVSGSVANDVHGNLQSGGVLVPLGAPHAGFWRGTRESFVDLHPAGAAGSGGTSTDGALQGGSVEWPGSAFRAAIWNGTAQSMVELGPTGTLSQVRGMAPGVQVGFVHFVGGDHAAMWRGSRESFIDLNPSGGTTRLNATSGRIHVGQGGLGGPGFAHALINFGSPSAWVDLHQFLPPGYPSFSEAKAVYQDGPTIYVGGYAESSAIGNSEAILWIGSDPCYPNCDQSNNAPVLNVSDFICFLSLFNRGDRYANCDQSTTAPVLNVSDFICFLNRFAAGCS